MISFQEVEGCLIIVGNLVPSFNLQGKLKDHLSNCRQEMINFVHRNK